MKREHLGCLCQILNALNLKFVEICTSVDVVTCFGSPDGSTMSRKNGGQGLAIPDVYGDAINFDIDVW